MFKGKNKRLNIPGDYPFELTEDPTTLFSVAHPCSYVIKILHCSMYIFIKRISSTRGFIRVFFSLSITNSVYCTIM